jgi:peptide/nickel transport system substrate-binding protein
MRRRVTLALGAALATVVVAGGCGKTAATTGTGTAPGDTGTPTATGLVTTTPAAVGDVAHVTWAVYRETNSLDPIFAFDYPENTALTPMCEGLMRQKVDGSLEPGLAESVDTADPLKLVFHLRGDATFWDGAPLTADDVVYSLERQTDPKLAGFYAAVYQRVDAIAATDAHTVTITLKQPDSWLLGELSSVAGMIVEKSFAAKAGTKYGTPDGGAMCTGAYKLKSWKVGEGITLVPNPAWWDKSVTPHVQELVITGVPDEAAFTSGLETGEIDGAFPLQLRTLDQLRSSSAVNVYEGSSYGTDAFIVSSFKGALGDVRVREALSLAIDRKGLIDATWKGASQLPRALANPGTWGYAPDVFKAGYDALVPLTQDLTKAKALVTAAGAAGKTIRFGMSSELAAIATSATAYKAAAEAIGMKGELVSVSAANYINFFIDPKARETVDGFFTINYPDAADPAGLYSTLALDGGSQNYAGYTDPAVTKALDDARSATDPVARATAVVAAETKITEDLVWIPGSSPNTTLIMNRKLTGAPATWYYMVGPWAAYLGAAG